jgi:hypothetical protein
MSVLGDFPRRPQRSNGNDALDDDPIIRGIRRDAIATWQKAREAKFAEMIYDDLSILDDVVAQLADRSKASATARKYAGHWAKFTKWTAEFIMDDEYPLSPLPACAELVAFYLLTELTRGVSYSGIKQISAAISDAHVTNQEADPTQSLVCRAAVRLARQHTGKFPQVASNGKSNGEHKEASDGNETA